MTMRLRRFGAAARITTLLIGFTENLHFPVGWGKRGRKRYCANLMIQEPWFAGGLSRFMSNASPSHDEQDLGHFGYAQELFRSMGGFSNFAISFSIISILTGAVTLYGYGL